MITIEIEPRAEEISMAAFEEKPELILDVRVIRYREQGVQRVEIGGVEVRIKPHQISYNNFTGQLSKLWSEDNDRGQTELAEHVKATVRTYERGYRRTKAQTFFFNLGLKGQEDEPQVH